MLAISWVSPKNRQNQDLLVLHIKLRTQLFINMSRLQRLTEMTEIGGIQPAITTYITLLD